MKSMTLADVQPGNQVEVVALGTLDPFLRQRLLDLGLTPGARVRPELSSAGRATRAYRMRGALVALRREQAKGILVRNRESR